jgi:hypothetical protein
MPKRTRKNLSTPQLLSLARERIEQTRQDVWELRVKMTLVKDRYLSRSWRRPESVLTHPQLIAQLEHISRLPLGKLPSDSSFAYRTRVFVEDETNRELLQESSHE